MAIKDQLRRRLVTSIAGALVVGSLLAGAVSVAANDDDTSGQANVETNQGTESVGVTKETTLTINSIVAAPAPSTNAAPAPVQDLPQAAPNDGRDDMN